MKVIKTAAAPKVGLSILQCVCVLACAVSALCHLNFALNFEISTKYIESTVAYSHLSIFIHLYSGILFQYKILVSKDSRSPDT